MIRFSKRLVGALLVAATLAGCIGTQKPIAGEGVDYTYRSFKLTWRNTGAFIQFRYTVKDVGGMVGVCGAYAESKGGRQTELTGQATARGFVEIDGERIVTGIDFFANHGNASSLAGKSSRCVVTDNPWLPSYSANKARLNFPNGSYKTT